MLLQNFLHNANWLAIVVSVLFYFALGSLWFSVLFGKQWMAGNGIEKPTPEKMQEMKKTMPRLFALTFLMNVVIVIAVAMMVMALRSTMCLGAIKLGLALSAIGVIPQMMSNLYLMKPVKLWIIDAGYHIVAITIVTIILSVWHH